MKKIYITFLLSITFILGFLSINSVNADDKNYIIDNMSPTYDSILKVDDPTNDNSGVNILDSILQQIKDITFGILPTVAMFVFLLIGLKLFIARGNAEEFKKALLRFVYAAIGMSVIPMARGIIYLITTLNI